MPLFAQDSLPEKKHNFFFEPSLGLQAFVFTELNGGGKYDPYLMYLTQLRLTFNVNFIYMNKIMHAGAGVNIFQIGNRPVYSNQSTVFGLYDAYLRLGYNFMSLSKNQNFRFGPFVTFGRVRPTLYTRHIKNNFSIGVELYKRNFSLSLSHGYFSISDEEIEYQGLGSDYYLYNNVTAFNFGWYFPIRYPEIFKI
jgi:hypothetical protein